MAQFTFYLSAEDTDRIFALKKLTGHDDLTGNEYARRILERELHRLFPAVPEFDEQGEVMNTPATIQRRNG